MEELQWVAARPNGSRCGETEIFPVNSRAAREPELALLTGGSFAC
jgi:hypothetical protein